MASTARLLAGVTILNLYSTLRKNKLSVKVLINSFKKILSYIFFK